MMPNIVRVLVIAMALTIIFPLSVRSAEISGKPRVIDGDTIEVSGERIRLHGIDTPETNQRCTDISKKRWDCGRRATSALIDLIGGQSVVCRGKERDRYRRLIGVCFVGEQNLNASMVRQGWALAYRKYSTDYVAQETAAKSDKVGIWSGQFVNPWDWRRGERLSFPKVQTCCKICRKGKACGNSCIRMTYTCRKPRGCACNAR